MYNNDLKNFENLYIYIHIKINLKIKSISRPGTLCYFSVMNSICCIVGLHSGANQNCRVAWRARAEAPGLRSAVRRRGHMNGTMPNNIKTQSL